MVIFFLVAESVVISMLQGCYSVSKIGGVVRRDLIHDNCKITICLVFLKEFGDGEAWWKWWLAKFMNGNVQKNI